mmetsp:Transcript_25288/g.68467  ORF Transcript_25288/g.68467 Transcript_25288/m.68467 type:complete len:341 (-) Transcript_25288:422-1444(-)
MRLGARVHRDRGDAALCAGLLAYARPRRRPLLPRHLELAGRARPFLHSRWSVALLLVRDGRRSGGAALWPRWRAATRPQWARARRGRDRCLPVQGLAQRVRGSRSAPFGCAQCVGGGSRRPRRRRERRRWQPHCRLETGRGCGLGGRDRSARASVHDALCGHGRLTPGRGRAVCGRDAERALRQRAPHPGGAGDRVHGALPARAADHVPLLQPGAAHAHGLADGQGRGRALPLRILLLRLRGSGLPRHVQGRARAPRGVGRRQQRGGGVRHHHRGHPRRRRLWPQAPGAHRDLPGGRGPGHALPPRHGAGRLGLDPAARLHGAQRGPPPQHAHRHDEQDL